MLIGKVYKHEININDFGKVDYFKIYVESVVPLEFEFKGDEQNEKYVMFRNLNDMKTDIQYCLIDDNYKFVKFVPFNLYENIQNDVKRMKLFLDYTIRGNNFDFEIDDIDYIKIDTVPYKYDLLNEQLDFLVNELNKYVGNIKKWINMLNEYINKESIYFFGICDVLYNLIGRKKYEYEQKYYLTK